MNNSFCVEKKVFEVLPDYCVGVIRASIPNKEGAAQRSKRTIQKRTSTVLSSVSRCCVKRNQKHFCLPFRPTKGWNKSK